MIIGQRIGLRFRKSNTQDNIVVSQHDGINIQLDKFDKKSSEVKDGELWCCEVLKHFRYFTVVKAIDLVQDSQGITITDLSQIAPPESTATVSEIKKETFAPSKYQIAVTDFAKKGKGNAAINAVAGSGKSTTLKMILESLPKNKSILMAAFNRDIVEDLTEKVKHITNAEVTTWHSFGYRALRYQFKSEIDKQKYVNIAKMLFETIEIFDEEIDKFDYMIRCVRLCELARLNLANSSKEIERLAEINLIEILENECQIAYQLMEIGKKDITKIDYCDMLYLPIIHNVKVKTYDFVLCDEAQDQNNCQRELMKRAMKKLSGRFIAVGDPRQAIYLFAGSSSDSFYQILDIPNTIELPLSICYRCDAAIVNEAKTLVPYIEARDNAPKGEINKDADIADIKDGDMVLCRNTAPLIKLCYKFLRQGVKAYVQGKDIGINLISLIKSTKKQDIGEMLDKLKLESEKILKNLMRKHGLLEKEAREHQTFESFLEKIDIIGILSESCETAEDVIKNIQYIFDDKTKDGIRFSTIHRSKGLENDRVFLIQPNLLPSKRSMRSPELMKQEYNLQYVAITRAKHYYGVIGEDKFDIYKKTN